MKRLTSDDIQRAVALVAILLSAQRLPAQGLLTPPGAPAATMKSLAQIEPRTPISSVPFTIDAPGSYFLTMNLTSSVANAIVIAANGVTLDLSGFTLSSTVTNAASGGAGVLISSGLSDITVLNGHIRGGVTNNGSGVYSGSGFASGIVYSGTQPKNTHVSGISVSGCLSFGIYLNVGDSTVVESCTVRTTGNYGIRASSIKNSVAVDCAAAIYGDQVSDCRGETTGNGSGIFALTALNCYGSSGGSGDGIDAETAENCRGISTSGDGVDAFTALNCYGSSGSGTGVSAVRNASNCYGFSSTGRGLFANNASFCTGNGNGGIAIQATIATGCFAAGGTNIITYKYNMP
jgi:hypothetical protein